jgi:MFS family permease
VQSDDAFLAWGWRIPFLLSGVLVAVGLWVRLSISESPVFLAAQRQAEEEAAAGITEKPPVVEVLRRSRRDVLTAIGTRFGENISYYVLTSFLLVYVTTHLDLSKSTALNAVLIASAIHFVAIPMWGALSDRIGRRPVSVIGAAGMAVWAFVFFALVDTGSFAVITVSVTTGLLLHGAMYGPQAAFISELFDTKVRYSGASIGSQLASIVAGALAPIIAVELLRDFDSSLPVSIYLAFAGLVTTVTVLLARETRGRDLSQRSATAPGTVSPGTAKLPGASPAGNV